VRPHQVEQKAKKSEKEEAGLKFRENAMHGSVPMLKKYKDTADVNEVEAISQRTALHKAAFWGHIDAVKFLVTDCKLNVNAQDYSGDTPLHDTVRFGHKEVAQFLQQQGADPKIRNKKNQTVTEVATEYGYGESKM